MTNTTLKKHQAKLSANIVLSFSDDCLMPPQCHIARSLVASVGPQHLLLIASPVLSHSTTHSLTCVLSHYCSLDHLMPLSHNQRSHTAWEEITRLAVRRCHLACFSVSAQFCMLINRWNEMFRCTNQHGTYFFNHAVEQQNARK